jgi:hypothetical protein
LAVLKFKIIKFSNHRADYHRSRAVGSTECSEAIAEFDPRTGTHRIAGFDRAGRRWSIEIDHGLFEQMKIQDALWGGRLRGKI